MKRGIWIIPLALLLIVGLFVARGIVVVEPGERIALRRLGRIQEPPWDAGPHWSWPAPIDRLTRVRTDEVRRIAIGAGEPSTDEAAAPPAEYLTGDHNFIRVRAVLQYRVADPIAFVRASDQVPALVARMADAALAEALSHRPVDEVLGGGRSTLATTVSRELRANLDAASLGVELLGVSITDALPPTEVAPDFAAAQAARSQRDQRAEAARSIAATRLVEAHGEAAAAIQNAHGSANTLRLAAQAEAARFETLLTAAQSEPTLTRRRLHAETLQHIARNVGRTLVLPPQAPIDLSILTGPSLTPPAQPADAPDAAPPSPESQSR